jgi:hypothetical protein
MDKRLAFAVLGAAFLALAAPAYGGGVIRVPAGAGWYDTGAQLVAGAPYAIEADGSAVTAPASIFHGPGGFGAVSGPDGQAFVCGAFESPGFVCQEPSSAFGTLVGRIGATGTPFRVGSSLTLNAPETGELYLAVNDFVGYHVDNLGGFSVRVALVAGPILETASTFPTNFYFNCRPDHNIGVPAGKRLVAQIGWGATTRGLIDDFLNGIEMRAAVDGVPIADPMRYWSEPFLSLEGTLWVTRWVYDTGIVSTFDRSYSIDIAVDANHTINDGVAPFTPDSNPIADSDGPCSVTAF